MNRYHITGADEIYAAEFKRNLDEGNAFNSPGLQRVLNVMRAGPTAGKYVLVVRVPFKRYVLARMPALRGQPVEILHECEFTDLAEAEWAVFKRRWYEQTDEHLDI